MDTTQADERVYYVRDVDGQQFGPHSQMEIIAMVQAGSLSATALTWREGDAGWSPLPPHVQGASPVALPQPIAGQPVTVTRRPLSALEQLAASLPPARHEVNVRIHPPARRERSPFEIGFMVTMGVLVALFVWSFFNGCLFAILTGATSHR
jgi:hypothetical protein